MVKDDEEFENRRLHAVPVSSLVGDRRFTDLVRDHTGGEPVLQPVELDGSLDCRLAKVTARTPGSLLSAAAEVVPFHGREKDLAGLAEWRDGGSRLSVKLLIGEGGQGKSRLAREFLRASRASGWVAGQIEPARLAAQRKLLDEQEQRLRASELAQRLVTCTTPALVVCDYAEVHPVFVDTLVGCLAEQSLQRPVRLLLLARTAGAWWQDLTALLGDAAGCLELGSLSVDQQARQEAYRAAVTGLADGLAVLPGQPTGREPVRPWPVLADRLKENPPALTRRDTALALQMIALLNLLQAGSGTEPTAGERPEHLLVEHERDYLRRTAAGKGLFAAGVLSTATDQARRQQQAVLALDRALAGLILFGPCDRHLAQQVARLASEDRTDDVVDWLATLYPPTPGYYLSTGVIQPDRLAEYLLGGILTAGDAVDSNLVSQLGAMTKGLETAQSVLFALVRTAAHQPFHRLLSQVIELLITKYPDPFATAAPFLAPIPAYRGPLLNALRRLGERDPAALSDHLGRVYNLVPSTSVSLAVVGSTITGILVDLSAFLAEMNREAYLPDLAAFHFNHAAQLREAGQRERALVASQEAVRLHRELADADPEALPLLAGALSNHAAITGEAGRPDDAVLIAEEALELARGLVLTDREAWLHILAMALVNHAAWLADVGQLQDALPVSEEAVEIHRELVRVGDGSLPGLAASVNNHSLRLAALGQREQALLFSEEAVQLGRKLVDADRDAFLPELARSLANRATQLMRVGQTEQALAVSEESVRLRRELAATNGDMYFPVLASSLNDHAFRLTEDGQSEQAVRASEEAVTFYRGAAKTHRDAFLPKLATALTNYAIFLTKAGQPEEALLFSRESVALHREVVGAKGDAFLSGLVSALNTNATVLTREGRWDEAVPVSGEAVRFAILLVSDNRDAFLPLLVNSLVVHGRLPIEQSRFRSAVRPLVAALLLVHELPPHARDMGESIAGLLHKAFAGDPAGVAAEYLEMTGSEVPEWMRDPIATSVNQSEFQARVPIGPQDAS
ncbi:tetratricopeptide repeat protein [Streptomyces sp. NBC_00554]|uniref:tetratricopeptide repeat protein n=1 Tax=Streptomyces sp. NBC_00554 TaxID=2903661 RepID=UPI00352DB432|nr:tetratricopeptide repeat protein [Streptomyces sp. NBC_00554]